MAKASRKRSNPARTIVAVLVVVLLLLGLIGLLFQCTNKEDPPLPPTTVEPDGIELDQTQLTV